MADEEVSSFVEDALEVEEQVDPDVVYIDPASMAVHLQWLRRETNKQFHRHMSLAAEEERTRAASQYLDMREQQLRARENNVLLREQQLGLTPPDGNAMTMPSVPPRRRNRRHRGAVA
jgi:hypothetical protein